MPNDFVLPDMDTFYRTNATPEKAKLLMADFICSMIRASAAEQSASAVTLSCQNQARPR